MATIGVAEHLYLEKFGLDATTMGLLVTLISFWAPFQEVFMGRLQDRKALAWCFPVERWGRRAPWLLTHGCLGAAGASAIFLPPEGDLAYAWFAVAWVTATWGICGCIIAFEAARQEIYPYKEERMVVESLCKYACMAGGAAGGMALAYLSIDASLHVRLAFLPYLVAMGVLSLEAVPIFKETRLSLAGAEDTQVSVPHGKKDLNGKDRDCTPEAASYGAFTIIWEALPLQVRLCLGRLLGVCRLGGTWEFEKPNNHALQHMIAVKFWNGAYGATISNMLVYYVTYVLRLSGWARVRVAGGAAITAGCTEAVMNLVCVRLFAAGDGRTDETGRRDRQLLRIVVGQRLLNAALTALLMGALAPSVPVLFLWTVVSRTGLCSFSFWRISAQCWLADEDCFAERVQDAGPEGRRRNKRQGMIFGALSMCQTLALAIFGSLLLLGLGRVGFQTKNCEAACHSAGGPPAPTAESSRSCVDECFQGVIDGQPDSVRLYVRLVMGVFAPLCELLIALHTYLFPIKGVRLRQLYALVAENLAEDSQAGGARASRGSAPASKLQPAVLGADLGARYPDVAKEAPNQPVSAALAKPGLLDQSSAPQSGWPQPGKPDSPLHNAGGPEKK